MALQFSFDLRFLQTLLVSREAKDSRAPTFTSLMERVDGHIDPFDLSVFSSHLETRVRWAAARSVAGLAALVPPDRAALVASYKVTFFNTFAPQYNNKISASLCHKLYRRPGWS